MAEKLKRKDLEQIITHFGIEKVIAALPQKEVCTVLELVSLKQLTEELGIGYDSFRSYMHTGVIPYPEVRILRRAYFRKGEAEMIRKKLK